MQITLKPVCLLCSLERPSCFEFSLTTNYVGSCSLRFERALPCLFFYSSMMDYLQWQYLDWLPQWHCCESATLSKRPTLIFCANISLWCVCAYGKCSIITFRYCIPTCILAPHSVSVYMFNNLQNQSCDVRDPTTMRCKGLCRAFQSAHNSIFPLCVQTSFTK